MPIVDLSRSSSFSRQRHHMSLGHGSWGLVDQVLDRHWERQFTWSGSSYSAARPFGRGQEQSNSRHALIMVRKRERFLSHDLCSKNPQLSIHGKVDVDRRAVHPDIGPDQIFTSTILNILRDRMLEPPLMDRSKLAELHALVRGPRSGLLAHGQADRSSGMPRPKCGMQRSSQR